MATSGGVDQHLAVLFGLGQHGIPDIGCVDVAACEGGGDLRRLQVQNVDFRRVDARVLQREQQAVVRGRNEWRRDLLADEILDVVDAGAVADDEALCLADEARDDEGLDRRAARHAGGKRT